MASGPQTSFAVPVGATRLTLVRHGQTQGLSDSGEFELLHGHGNPLITDLGQRQAAAVADRLGQEKVDHLYVSSLTRTHETAAPLATRLGISPREEHDLREVFLGDWEGGQFRTMMAEQIHPAAIAFRKTYEWGELPGAESNQQLIDRTSSVVSSIHERHPDEHVVAFVHGGVIAALCAATVQSPMRGFSGSDNCSIHRLVLTDDHWFLRGFNDINHLGDLRSPPAVIATLN